MALMIKPHGKTASEKALRMVGMFIIFGIVAWAFWMNNQSTLEKIQARNALWDQSKVLNKSERNFLQGFIRSMRTEFGVKVRIQILDKPAAEQEYDPKELYIGLSPDYEEVVMQFPGLVRHALGAKFISELQGRHFAGNFTEDKWPTSLMTAVSMIWDRLVNVQADQPVVPVYSEDGSGNMTDPESSGSKE